MYHKTRQFWSKFDFFFWLIGNLTIGETEKSHFKDYRNLKYHKISIFFSSNVNFHF